MTDYGADGGAGKPVPLTKKGRQTLTALPGHFRAAHDSDRTERTPREIQRARVSCGASEGRSQASLGRDRPGV